jgi:hypothetical protein
MKPFYCEGPAHDSSYPTPILGHADNPEYVHVLCSVCAKAAREAQAKNNTRQLRQYVKLSAPAARARLVAGEKPDESPLSELPPPPPPKIGPLARLQP